jgi:hypothetical protein
MEIVLYYAPNTCALAPYVTLAETGAISRSGRSISASGRISRPSS